MGSLKSAVKKPADKGIDAGKAAQVIDQAAAAPSQTKTAGKKSNGPAEGFKRTTIDIPEDMMKSIKLRAIEEGKRASVLLREWIEAGLKTK